MQNLADYSDAWVVSDNQAFEAHYCCTAECGHVIESKEWQRANEPITDTKGQRWYCTCGRKYKTANGLLIEMTLPKDGLALTTNLPTTTGEKNTNQRYTMDTYKIHYFRAELPPSEIWKIKARLVRDKQCSNETFNMDASDEQVMRLSLIHI